MQVNDRILMAPFPPNYKKKSGGRDDCERGDEVRLEPVIALPFIENDLKTTQTHSHQTKADVVNLRLTQLAALEVWRILDKARSQKQRQNPDRDINEENPSPGVVVGDPAAERWTDGRSHNHRDAIHGEGHASLRGWKSISEDGLLAWLQASTAGSLQNAEDDEGRQVWRKSAQERTHGEKENATHVEALAAHDR